MKYNKQINDLIDTYDKTLKILRRSKEQYHGQRYRYEMYLFPLSLKNLKDAGTIMRLIIGIVLLLLPPGAAFVTEWASPGKSLWVSLIIIVLWYIYSVYTHLKEMCDIESPHFHYDAYKKRRKNEFLLFSTYLNGDNFEIADLKKEYEELEKQIESGQNKGEIDKIVEMHTKRVQILEKEIKESEREILFLEKLSQKTINIIESFIEDKIDQKVLNIFNGFVLYKYKEGYLKLEKQFKARGTVESDVDINSVAHRREPCVEILRTDNHYLKFTEGYTLKYEHKITGELFVIKLFIDDSSMKRLNSDNPFGKMNLDLLYDLVNLLYPCILPNDKERQNNDSITG
ncbi:hypothetical protein ELQ35_00550 [Peribacillus cavernae]|uniref:Uncharacterized protein n=1 Tax=Peribacillus cavernae TaxID=1674310 RepID=A0A3S0U2D9_9BACI|nr:hypothetical protein [Peribacillus cavernae]MDQ0217977.1 hypothetical protein [Peribacillus cavernae]RUQ32620.1 hypothetical protein ELQ35_00550 [Peribacillus cavernae]